MKARIKQLLLFLVLLYGNGVLGQTVMTIIWFDGIENDFELSTETSIKFVSDSLALNLSSESNTPIFYGVDEVRKLCFTESIIADVDALDSRRIILFPNPVDDYFYIENVKEERQLIIYAINGIIITQTQYWSDRCVDVSSLHSGIYIVRVGNKIGKFTKK